MQSVLNEKRWHQMHRGQWCIDKLTSLISMYFLDKLQKNIVDIIIFWFFRCLERNGRSTWNSERLPDYPLGI